MKQRRIVAYFMVVGYTMCATKHTTFIHTFMSFANT